MNREGKFKSEEEEDDDDVSWQDSYSDLMTDLLAVFVVLFSFSMMSQAFAAEAASKQMLDSEAEMSIIEQMLPGSDSILDGKDGVNSLFKSIEAYINEEELSEQLSVTDQGENQILIRASSSVFFDTAQAKIKSDAEPIIKNISKILAEHEYAIKMIRIEGHTDNRPINTKEFQSNWYLSTNRAVNVLEQLLEMSQIGADKFSAVGYGEFHPIDDNDTELGMSQNRRVDFIIEGVNK